MKSEGRMATGTRRRYTEDFKQQEAVRLVRALRPRNSRASSGSWPE